MSFTTMANPLCEDAPPLAQEAAGAEPAAGTPAMSDAYAYMMSQDIKGISFSIIEETLAFTIQPGIAGIRPSELSPPRPTRTSPCATCRRSYVRPFHEGGNEWTPPDAKAGSPAEGDDAAERLDLFTSSSGFAAQYFAGIWTPPPLENE
eukprot:584452-Pyramimonas_sp.AAC.1